ncbi:Alpha/Beta hydrolase protein [Mycena floridula]|nr:Alpha/Beta hydrolase protein [Mycena floridula]
MFQLILSLAFLLSANALSSPLGPVIDLGYAAFAGNSTSPAGIPDGPVTFYGNIPFAEPPLGNLRWRAPKMLNENASAERVTDARNWGSPCLQSPAAVGIGSEDCLKLNVWKPTNISAGAKLPVAVYIHGGGFFDNASEMLNQDHSPMGYPLYDWVAQHPTGLVGVSLAYRISMMGFLGGSLVKADGNLNAGLLDQRAGLEWVQRHIASFGGDPNNVTIYGESAGGASVIMQLVAYGGTKPLPFKAVVAQSIGFGPTPTDAQVEASFTDAATHIGCPTTGSEALECMREASLGAIVSAINRARGSFAPVLEGPGGFLPDLPSRLIRSGNFSNVDLMAGHCTGDGKTFAGGRPEQFVTEDDVKRLVFARMPSVSNATREKGLAMYPLSDAFPTQWDRAWSMASDVVFSAMDWFLAEALTARGVQNVFSYAWNVPDPVLYNANPYLGAMHISDLYFLFEGHKADNAGHTFTPFNASEAIVAKEAIAFWTSFARNHNPTTEKMPTSPAWEPFAPSTEVRQRMVLNRGDDTATLSAMETISAAEMERWAFWMSEDVVAETRV